MVIVASLLTFTTSPALLGPLTRAGLPVRALALVLERLI